MCVPPHTDDPKGDRPSFRNMRGTPLIRMDLRICRRLDAADDQQVHDCLET